MLYRDDERDMQLCIWTVQPPLPFVHCVIRLVTHFLREHGKVAASR